MASARQRVYRFATLAAILTCALTGVLLACTGEDPDLVPSGQQNDGGGGGGGSDANTDTSAPTADSGGTLSDVNNNQPDTGVAAHTIACLGKQCSAPTETCCVLFDSGVGDCVPRGTCDQLTRSSLDCDSRDDCAPSEYCCGRTFDGKFWSSSCALPNAADNVACAERALCRIKEDCPDGSTTCAIPAAEFSPSGFLICQ